MEEGLILFVLGAGALGVLVFVLALIRLSGLGSRVERLESELRAVRAELRQRQGDAATIAALHAPPADAHAAGAPEAPGPPAPVAASPPSVTPHAPIEPPAAIEPAAATEPVAPQAPADASPIVAEPPWLQPDVPVRAARAPEPPPAETAHTPPRHEPAPAPPRPALDSSGLEQLIGGVWLQNLGAVLLLVGVFLMIVWGYTTGRLGPQVLVGAGVALGLGFVWRGDHVSRRVPAFGHALIGVGLGIVYITLHLGHVRLHVLPPWLAFPALVAVSVGAMLAGLRYRVQLIAALGVIGAYLPHFLGAWLNLPGLQLPPAVMLGYLAAINVLVFALAARAGWSALDLTSVLLSAFVWMAAYGDARWGWGTEAGLCALFTLLGLAPLPRLVGVQGRVRPMDLAVISVAPLALLLVSAPFARDASATTAAMFLLALAAAMLGAALWVDSRRPERDLWAPLTGAGTLYATAAIERLLGPDRTPMAWCVEGVVLVWLGLRERGGWLRLWGTLVAALGALAVLARVAVNAWTADSWPVLYPQGLSHLGCVLALLAGAGLLARGRHWLSRWEQPMPETWTALAHALLALWIGVESSHMATMLTQPGSAWMPAPPPPGVPIDLRQRGLHLSMAALGWTVQATALTWRGAHAGRGFLRVLGGALMALAVFPMMLSFMNSGWAIDQHPVLHFTALATLAAIALVMATSVRLARREGQLTATENHAVEAWAALGYVLMAAWAVAESSHVATALTTPGSAWWPAGAGFGAALDARRQGIHFALAALAGTALAAGYAVIGLRARRPFLRAIAMVGLVLAAFALVAALGRDGWASDLPPVLHVSSLAVLAAIALMIVTAVQLASRRGELSRDERRAPEIWAGLACAGLMLWSRGEAGHLAIAFAPGSLADPSRVRTLRSVFTDGAWLAQAVTLLVLGWWRGSAFLRWSALLLLAITLLRFVIVDLQTVDVFWRFLTAIVVGAAMLAMSYAYQRKQRGKAEAD